MSKLKKCVLTPGFVFAVLTLTLLTGAQESRKGQSDDNSSKPMQKERPKDRSVKNVRLTAADIARLPAGKNLVVDLTRRGIIYHLNPTSHAIDYSRVRVRSAAGEVTMEAWLMKQLPRALRDNWMSRSFRFGAAKYLSHFPVPEPRQSHPQAYTTEGGLCTCSGDDDCNNMFSDDVCIDQGLCIEDDVMNPQCSCICGKPE